MERRWWPEKPLVSGWSETRYVAEAAVFFFVFVFFLETRYDVMQEQDCLGRTKETNL